jgi:predicted nucleic acid-binding protein
MKVFDANVLLSGLRSSNGASNVTVREVIKGSVPGFLERSLGS